MNAVEGQDQQKKLGEDMASEQQRINKYVKEGKTIAEATAMAKADSTEGVIKSAQAAEEITRALEMVKRSLMEAMLPLAQKIFSTKNIQAFVKFAKKAISFLGKVVEIIANNFEIILMALVAWKGIQMIRGIKNMIFGERGSNMMNPVYTYNVNYPDIGSGFAVGNSGYSVTFDLDIDCLDDPFNKGYNVGYEEFKCDTVDNILNTLRISAIEIQNSGTENPVVQEFLRISLLHLFFRIPPH